MRDSDFYSRSGSFSGLRAEAAYHALLCRDWAGAWLLLKQVREHDPADAQYNKALCLLQAGEPVKALEAVGPALRIWENQAAARAQTPDTVYKALLQQHESLPPPLEGALAEAHPAHAVLLGRWLMVRCLLSAGRTEEARQAAGSLLQHGLIKIKDIDEMERNVNGAIR